MAELNRPLSKIDIFYTGSIKNLAERKKSIAAKSIVEEDAVEPTRSDLFLSTIGLPTADDYADSGVKLWFHKYLNVSISFCSPFYCFDFSNSNHSWTFLCCNLHRLWSSRWVGSWHLPPSLYHSCTFNNLPNQKAFPTTKANTWSQSWVWSTRSVESFVGEPFNPMNSINEFQSRCRLSTCWSTGFVQRTDNIGRSGNDNTPVLQWLHSFCGLLLSVCLGSCFVCRIKKRYLCWSPR